MEVGNSFGLVDTYLPQHIIAIRLVLAGIFGAIIGFEREQHSSGAGLRTHILIAIAASLFTILAFEIFHTIDEGGQGGQGGQRADPIRAVEAVTAGIAFLGAGAIFRRGSGVQGLTTGAGMWLAGAVGVATALGHYIIAGGVALLAVLVMASLRFFAHQVLRQTAPEKERLDP
ncbi:MAG: MgtC/SapB family protein [Devosia sp.]|jgi:putative Mg2+ transporter-C (MgtC) family protein|uniref:MgtC/SapB family protein n=1 Tax=unclassified Devosia TaxID=196773 RepID=UPI001A038DAA|nr:MULTISPECIES: MgtC/SapB family protein [unclassified Devosia]MBF0677550.1 MgtC/SapB family protein [Devosia sp.]WEJ34389.1 MgtC/SapB family protein [Devosia sp. SD17-2]